MGGLTELHKWEPGASTVVYLGHSLFHARSVDLILNIITGNIYPQYHMLFDYTLSTFKHMRNVTVPGN